MRTHQARLNKITLIVALALSVHGLRAQERYEFSSEQAMEYARKNSVAVKKKIHLIHFQVMEL